MLIIKLNLHKIKYRNKINENYLEYFTILFFFLLLLLNDK